MRTPSEMSGQLLLLDLARGVPRELLDKAYVAGHFVPRQVVLDVLLDGIGVESRPRSGRDVARSRCPNSSSSTPTTATSTTPVSRIRQSSTSCGKTFSPPETIMSSSRP